jgi:transcription elongation factor GreA
MSEKIYMTKEGLENLKQELNQLKTHGRREMAKQIAEARDKGDLSENAEYDAAKEAQGLHEMKIAKMEDTFSKSVVLNEAAIDTSKVSALCTVKVKNLKINKEFDFTLVSESEADLKKGKISVGSPIGKGLLGHTVGEIVEIDVPQGKMKFEVLDISIS